MCNALFPRRDLIDVSTASNYALRVSTYNANALLVEPSQVSPPPTVYTSSDSASSQSWLWFEQFHLQSPLDNLEDHSYIVIELINKELIGSLAWGRVSLDRQVINSETRTLTLVNGDAVHSTLEVELSITKR